MTKENDLLNWKVGDELQVASDDVVWVHWSNGSSACFSATQLVVNNYAEWVSDREEK